MAMIFRPGKRRLLSIHAVTASSAISVGSSNGVCPCILNLSSLWPFQNLFSRKNASLQPLLGQSRPGWAIVLKPTNSFTPPNRKNARSRSTWAAVRSEGIR
jgi:hypothetical protein